MEKSFSINSTIWRLSHLIDVNSIKITDIDAYFDLLHMTDKELDSFETHQITTRDYEELEQYLYNEKQELKRIKVKETTNSESSFNKVEELIDSMIKKSNKKRQERIKQKFSDKLNNVFYNIRKHENREVLESYLGVSQQTVSAYFNGKNSTMPGYEKLVAISKFLDCSCDYLINEEVTELAVGYGTISKETGLNSQSIESLRRFNLHNSYHGKMIADTLNLLISKVSINEGYESDALTAIAEYFNEYLSRGKDFYGISEEALVNFEHQLREVESLEEIQKTFKLFKNGLDIDKRTNKYTYADVDTLHLTNIQVKLSRTKEEIENQMESEIEEDLLLFSKFADSNFTNHEDV